MEVLVSVATPQYGRLIGAITPAKLTPLSIGSVVSTISHTCQGARWASSSSSSIWKRRQEADPFAREAKLKGLKSRAAFKLLEIDNKYRLFKRGNTVVDLGYAPGSWSQVAKERTKPNGRVVGIDLIPAQPPKGVSTIQGDFLSPHVQKIVKDYLAEYAKPRSAAENAAESLDEDEVGEGMAVEQPSYIDVERGQSAEHDATTGQDAGKLVDIVLSDMWEPWPVVNGYSSKTLSNPYYRMMNTSGMKFRDHAGSMDLCQAALRFASDTLRTGGHFVCKFYQGGEDKALEKQLKKMFQKVHREKPESSRDESKEAFFVALRRKGTVTIDDTLEQ